MHWDNFKEYQILYKKVLKNNCPKVDTLGAANEIKNPKIYNEELIILELLKKWISTQSSQRL